jgi:Acetyltransferase (GNAT) domain
MQVIAFDLAEADKRQRYDDLFNACPHAFIQQSTSWADVIRDLGPDQPIFLLANDNGRDVGGLPLYLFRGRPGPILTSVPHAGPLGGIYCRTDIDQEAIYAGLLAEADRLARAHRCLALTLITSPLVDDLGFYRRHLDPSLVFENFTQIVDIGKAVRGDELIFRSSKKRKFAAEIRKAEAAGFSTKLCMSEAEFDRWYSIHVQRAAEIGIPPLKRRMMERIWRDLGRQGRSFLQLVLAGDEIAAGYLFAFHRDVCDVMGAAMDRKHARHSPNYLVFKKALLEGARRGVRFMNWQSSPSRNDGVYNFKKQWASDERLYYFVTKIYCDEAVILGLGADGTRREYPDHFLVPFGVFDTCTLAGSYAKGR